MDKHIINSAHDAARAENAQRGYEGKSTKPHKVQLHYAGGFYRARYEGRKTNCFGIIPAEAIHRLKLFDGGAV